MQKSFSDLSHRGQVRRMTGLARSALNQYGLDDARITLLAHLWNTTFRVVTTGGDRYLLRIHHPEQISVRVVNSELLWLSALRQEANVWVPEPVRSPSPVAVVAAPGIPRPRLCVLLHWVDGRFAHRALTPSHLFQVGKLMAHLHEHSIRWQRPDGFWRGRVDNLYAYPRERNDDFNEAVAARAVETVRAVSTPEAGADIAELIRRIWTLFQAMGKEPAVFGLIHGDLHQKNYLFHGGTAGAIDFDDCGYGHWLYDLAVTLNEAGGYESDSTALRGALLEGYRQIRALSLEHERYLDTFIALRRLQDLLGMITERDHPAFRDKWQRNMSRGLQRLRAFVRS